MKNFLLYFKSNFSTLFIIASLLFSAFGLNLSRFMIDIQSAKSAENLLIFDSIFSVIESSLSESFESTLLLISLSKFIKVGFGLFKWRECILPNLFSFGDNSWSNWELSRISLLPWISKVIWLSSSIKIDYSELLLS